MDAVTDAVTDDGAEERADPVTVFAARLRRWQVDCRGPSVRDLERLTGRLGTPFTRGTIQDKLTGRSAAAWEFVEAFVRACAVHAGSGEPDLRQWRAWHAQMVREVAAARAGRRRSSVLEVCPYRGLEAFTLEHAGWFHGRASAVQGVVAALGAHREGVLLLGPSGAGKSSLVQAGVLAALAAGDLPGSDRWVPVLAEPGKDVSGQLERAGWSEEGARGGRLVLVVDQFEEWLAPASSDEQDQARRQELDRLTGLIGTPGLTVLLIMRDDFYSRLASYAPDLLDAMAPGLVNAPATLGVRDLHEIITMPAEAVGLRCQEGLAERIVSDVLACDPDSARTRRVPTTVLPLVELTLEQLWQRRSDGYLTHEAYQRVGGVSGGLTAWCDTVLDQLTPARQLVARRILTALVRPADDLRRVPAIRQQVPLATLRELADAAPSASGDTPVGPVVDEVMSVLTSHRLVTTRITHPVEADVEDVAVAELAHDALIRDWGSLRTWIDEDHRFQDWLRRAGERQARWGAGHDAGDLLHGTELAEGVEWAARRRLPDATVEFVAASRRFQLSGVRRARRATIALAALLAVAVVATGLAVWQQQTAAAAEQVALSRQLAAQSAALLDVDYDLAALLSVKAYRTSPTREALSSLYTAASRPLLRRLVGHRRGVESVAFSPDGRLLATGGDDGTARLWDTGSGHPRATLAGHTAIVRSVAFSPDGRTLATGSYDGSVRLWDVGSGRARTTLTGRMRAVESVAYSPDGRTLATGSYDGSVRLWDTGSGQVRAELPAEAVKVAFSSDGRTLATGGSDGTVRLWDVAAGRPLAVLTGHVGTMEALAFSPDGHGLATASGGDDRTVRLWDVRGDTRPRLTLPAHALTLAFSPDGRTLATGSNDGTVQLWDTAGGQARRALPGVVFSLAFSPDGRTLATGSGDGTIGLWDLAAGQARATLTGHTGAVASVAFSPDGRTLATGSGDGTVRLWDPAGGQARATLTGHTGAVASVAFSLDGRTLVTGGEDGTVRLWDLATARTRTTLKGPCQALAFSPDGATLVTGDFTRTVQLWDLPGGRPRTDLTGLAVWGAFSPDGRTVATGHLDGTLRVWDADNGQARTTITGHTGAVDSVAFSPDGRTIATGGDDRTVELWDVPGGPRATLIGHTGPVESVAFSPDGRTLATGSDDTTVRLWEVPLPTPPAAADKICRTIQRDLTPQERATYLPAGQHAAAVCPPAATQLPGG